MVEREIGLAPTTACRNACARVSEIQRRIDRGRQIVARQRELAAKIDERLAPLALTLLVTFEKSLSVFEKSLATHQHNETLVARSNDALRNSNALLAQKTANGLDPADATGLIPAHEEQMRTIACIVEILHEDGYQCEVLQETLH